MNDLAEKNNENENMKSDKWNIRSSDAAVVVVVVTVVASIGNRQNIRKIFQTTVFFWVIKIRSKKTKKEKVIRSLIVVMMWRKKND